jgi:AcrR family transcriptional regulator
MFKNELATDKGEQTRRHIFECALELFREKGFDATTMLDVATRAKVVKSAAYYYFPSKEAIIQAYYEMIQTEQNRLMKEAVSEGDLSLKQRLHVAMHSKFDLAEKDRRLLGVVFRYAGEPQHPLSCLGPATADIRRQAVEVFQLAIKGERLPKDLEELLPLALWALQMGLLVLFLYDETPKQARTRSLANGALALTVNLLAIAKTPLLRPIRTKVLSLLREADLLPER